MSELTLTEIRKRAAKRLAKIERENDIEPLVYIAYVGQEEISESKVVYYTTIKSKCDDFQFKGIGYTPEAAVNNSMAEGFLILLRLESRIIRTKVKELLS